MSTLSNVAIVGAAGSLGSVILQKLLEAGDFNVTVLRRLGSKSEVPAGAKVADVDFSSQESVVAALKGQDVLLSTVGTMAFQDQIAMVDAAAAAGIKRFIPSGFGSDLENPNTRKLPVFAFKVKVEDHLKEVCKTSGMTYTFVTNSAFLDWGMKMGFIFDVNSPTPLIMDGGDSPFSTTTLATVGEAVVGILKHPAETENRLVYVHDLVTTQNTLLALARKIAPERSWEPEHVNLDDLVATSDKRLAEGIHDFVTFRPYIWRSILTPGYGGEIKKPDNELLGIKEKDEAFLVDVIKSVMA